MGLDTEERRWIEDQLRILGSDFDSLVKGFRWRQDFEGWGPCIICGTPAFGDYRCTEHKSGPIPWRMEVLERSHPLYDLLHKKLTTVCPKCSSEHPKAQMADYLCVHCRWG